MKMNTKNAATIYTGALAAIPFIGTLYIWYKQHKNELITYDEWKHKNNITLILAYIFIGLNCLFAYTMVGKMVDKNDEDECSNDDIDNDDII